MQLEKHAVVVVEVLVELLVVVLVLVVVVVVVEMIPTVVFGVVVTGRGWSRYITAQTVKEATMIVIMEITPNMHPISRDFLL